MVGCHFQCGSTLEGEGFLPVGFTTICWKQSNGEIQIFSSFQALERGSYSGQRLLFGSFYVSLQPVSLPHPCAMLGSCFPTSVLSRGSLVSKGEEKKISILSSWKPGRAIARVQLRLCSPRLMHARLLGEDGAVFLLREFLENNAAVTNLRACENHEFLETKNHVDFHRKSKQQI